MTYLTILPNLIANSIVGTTSATTPSSPTKIPQNPFSPRQGVFNVLTNRNAPLSSPISKLPIELLGEIFLLASGPVRTVKTSGREELVQVEPYTSFRIDSSPLNLTHVSRLWRFIAESLPALWSTLLLRGCLPYHPSLVELWIERSRNLPLHLSLNTNIFCATQYGAYQSAGNHGPDRLTIYPWDLERCSCNAPCMVHDEHRVRILSEILVTCCSRWKSVAFCFSMHHETAFLDLKPGWLPLLQTAVLVHSSHPRFTLLDSEMSFVNSHETIFWKAADSSPALSILPYVCGIPQLSSWSVLRSLRLWQTPDIAFLASCANLHSLTLFGYIPPTLEPILLPNLQVLTLEEVVDGYRLDSLLVPRLQTLAVTGRSPLLLANNIASGLEQSKANLIELSINITGPWTCSRNNPKDCPREDGKPLVELLQSPPMQSLTSFVMSYDEAPPSLVEALHHPTTLPDLRHLSLGCAQAHFASMKGLERRLRSSNEELIGLEVLEIIVYGACEAEIDSCEVEERNPRLTIRDKLYCTGKKCKGKKCKAT